ncbi:MAG: TonB-dependent receptor domain-containing protein, partial [Saprospiraceae bacterium]
FQNLSDVALNPNTLELAPGWKNTDTYQSPNLTGINFTIVEGSGPARRFVLDQNGRQITRNLGQAMAGGSYGRINQGGMKLDYNLGSGWSVNNHFRYQTIETGVKYGFALPTFYAPTAVLRLYLDGDAVDKDLINEFRINKNIEAGNSQHVLSAGMYYSTINQKPTTYSYLYNSSTDPNNIRASGIFPPGSPAPTTGSITRRGDYDENVTAVFFGDEMKFDNRLTINLGARIDWLALDMAETKIPYDKTLTRVEKFSDWSASLGANYLLSDRSALYGNVIRAYRMPDYSAFTSLERRADGKFLRLPDGLSNNEVVFNTELGVRTGFEGFGFDVALFYTNIDNRLASIFEDGLLVSKPLGQNRIQGAEASISFTGIRGLFVRSALTFQDARFADFKIPVGRTGTTLNVNPTGNLFGNTLINEGNNNYSIDLKDKKIPGVPNLIWNFVANYESKYFGLDFSSNINAGRYADGTNIIELGTLMIINAGAYARLPMRNDQDIRLGIQARNLMNDATVQGIAGVADNDTVLSTKQRNQNFNNPVVFAHGYTQLPGRVMVTLSYNF